MKALFSWGQFVYMFVKPLAAAKLASSLVSVDPQKERETLRYDYHLRKPCSPGQLKRNHTCGTLSWGRPSFPKQLPRSFLRRKAKNTEQISTGSRRRATELHSSSVVIWHPSPSSKPHRTATCCGPAVVATLGSSTSPDGVIHSPPAAALFSTRTISLQSGADHWAAVKNTKHETGNTHKESRHVLVLLLTFHAGTSEVSLPRWHLLLELVAHWHVRYIGMEIGFHWQQTHQKN